MGSDWSWSLDFPPGALTPALIDDILTLAEDADLSPHRPDGAVNGFSNDFENVDHYLERLDRQSVVTALATGTHSTNLWTPDEVDIFLTTSLGGPTAPPSLSFYLDSCWCWRQPAPEAEYFRRLHRQLTELWLAIAARTEAPFGYVEDEWTLEQIWRTLADPYAGPQPTPGHWPRWLGWTTYFSADYYQSLPPLPEEPGLTVTRTPDGGAVLALLDDPAAVDVLEFERFHARYQQWITALTAPAPEPRRPS
ncbi:hypothetical protein [Goodfellowiella coeruleoviolacea]|uniref:Uncharacterized protein n=1 Tax=Goodfellowiella coeruleoviolacea TaxID=334858 RepID=A0AAE3GK09_9PSEU|nr:hypothetical protein [Goodfellowiella coeruleoviolacea]MCP2169682.1 hypothetical protein [Goodfellowiella coeruleoviolacea]